MVFKFIVFATVLAYANAGNLISAPLAAAPLAYAAPTIAKVAAPIAVARAEPYDPNPQYKFGYDVQDGLTGDSKNQFEQRNGDLVQGSYSLTDPDGSRRTVDYTADPINGFNAIVRKEPLVAKALVAAPAIAKVATPLIQSAPILAQPAPLIRSIPTLAQPAPLIRSIPTLAQPAPLIRSIPTITQSSTLLKSYAAPAISYGAAPLLRSGSLLSASSLGYSAGLAATPALGYSAGYAAAPALGYSARIGAIPALGYSARYAAPSLGYSAGLGLSTGYATTSALGYSAGFGKLAGPALGYSSSLIH
ncbi:hypothetical protein HHI36_017473 [Cryptolaemus montrouzieri]|uniref:Cuticle protein n=1 Tax=Cryptolaemus montrouzieri TaxID=559131 RepID=A0ABD2NN09_9CUCU